MRDDMNQPTRTVEKDPVCGMTVDPDRAAAQSVHDGKTFHFCCQSCATKFAAEPEKYIGASAASAHRNEFVVPQAGIDSSKAVSITEPRSKQKIGPEYICPMDPEVRQDHPGACPKCGMALESSVPVQPASRIEYTCPMHPEIIRPVPGSCPICGMALEPRTVTAIEEENPELRDMTRRFWVSLVLTLPLLAIAMADMWPGMPVEHALPGGWLPWIQLLLATPVVLWGGWPFFQRGWTSIVNRSTNMFTLIAMGTGVAYLFSLVATVFPGIFPASFGGGPGGMNGAPP